MSVLVSLNLESQKLAFSWVCDSGHLNDVMMSRLTQSKVK